MKHVITVAAVLTVAGCAAQPPQPITYQDTAIHPSGKQYRSSYEPQARSERYETRCHGYGTLVTILDRHGC